MDRLEKLHLYISIFAAAVVTAVCIWRDESLYSMSLWVSITIVVFYVLGHFTRFYLTSTVFRKLEETGADENAVEELSAGSSEGSAYTDTRESDDAP